MSALKCAQLMGLNKEDWSKGLSENDLGRPWYICSTNALTGDGLEEGMKWLACHLLP